MHFADVQMVGSQADTEITSSVNDERQDEQGAGQPLGHLNY